jgi:hypothetical protein
MTLLHQNIGGADYLSEGIGLRRTGAPAISIGFLEIIRAGLPSYRRFS